MLRSWFMQIARLEARYAADCEHLLGRVRQRIRRPFWVPGEVVREAIWAAGFQVLREPLERGVLGVCDPEDRRVLFAKNFRMRLKCPWAASKVLTSTLAHELGHVRLHAAALRAGDWEPHWEQEATLYARVFLVPRPMLMNCLQVRGLLESQGAGQTRRWSYVLRLAEEFLVSGAFMAHTLKAYGLITFNARTRFIGLWDEAQTA